MTLEELGVTFVEEKPFIQQEASREHLLFA
jgi:hypothetical protein